ncbi:unnamed protein product [Urochloa decumbens]|uniref:Uncharacterized protein n=1 Tax=Urochloa decumbens TaxID=240449 RepID=A0ABC9BV54_9POAL
MAMNMNPYLSLPVSNFETLEDALSTLLEVPGYKRPRYVTVAKIRVRDADALAALLAVSKREAARKGQFLPPVCNEASVGHLVTAVGILNFLDVSLLPALELTPTTSQPLIDALGDCSRALKMEADAIGGAFGAVANSLANHLDSYRQSTPVNKPVELMRSYVKRLVTRVKALLNTTYTIA